MDYVYAVYQERSFTRAAKKLYVSQPAISAMVKKVEKQVGMSLFDRSTSPLTLTAAGEYYIQQAERIRQIEQESTDYFRQISRKSEAHVRICGAAIYQAYVFPSIIAAFLKQYPEVNVTWMEERSGLGCCGECFVCRKSAGEVNDHDFNKCTAESSVGLPAGNGAAAGGSGG